MQEGMFTGLRGSHVRLVGRYWVRFSLRTGGGLMSLLLVLLVGLTVAAMFVAPVEEYMKASPELGHTQGEAAAEIQRIAESRQVVGAVEWFLGSREGDAAYLLQENPALLSVILLIFLMLFPWIACVAGFNQTAGDISTRGLRYLLLRTERPNVFLGRFLGTVGSTAISIAGVIVLLGLYVGLKFGIYGFGEIVLWLAQGWLATMLVVLPYLALCAWVSCLIDSPFGSLAICLLLSGFPVIFLKLVDWTIRGDQGWLERLTPWGWKYELLSGDLPTRLLASGMMVAFAAGFLLLGLRHFSKRDL